MDEQEKNAREDTWPSQKMPGIVLQYYLKLMEIEQCNIYKYMCTYIHKTRKLAMSSLMSTKPFSFTQLNYVHN